MEFFQVLSFSSWLWLLLLIAFVIAEAITLNLVTIWFAVGALAALLVSVFSPVFGYQVLAFLAVSILCLLALKPLVSRFLPRYDPKALDPHLGRTAQVISPIQPNQPGRVRLDGVDWNARCTMELPKGSLCTVIAVDGTTLQVEPLTQES